MVEFQPVKMDPVSKVILAAIVIGMICLFVFGR